MFFRPNLAFRRETQGRALGGAWPSAARSTGSAGSAGSEGAAAGAQGTIEKVVDFNGFHMDFMMLYGFDMGFMWILELHISPC